MNASLQMFLYCPSEVHALPLGIAGRILAVLWTLCMAFVVRAECVLVLPLGIAGRS